MYDKPAIFLMGPTASGKTDVAVDLCQHYPLEIISVDSALVYRGMNIGTAKPSREVLKIAPHHLIDIREPDQAYSAADFRSDALDLIEDIHARGKIPFLVGGTMLYFNALENGLSQIPASDSEIRARLDRCLSQEGLEALYAKLQVVDPESAARVHPNDKQRILRALEVYEISGVSLSAWWKRQESERLPYPLKKFALVPPRSVLHERIEKRLRQMMAAGMVDEVKALQARGLDSDLPSMRTVGYRQVLEYLHGNMGFDAMIEKAIVATRRLAKRQITWIRSMDNVKLIDPTKHRDGLQLLVQGIENSITRVG